MKKNEDKLEKIDFKPKTNNNKKMWSLYNYYGPSAQIHTL